MASTIIVYDSVFGNTAEVARAIGAEFEGSHKVRVIAVQRARAIAEKLSGSKAA